MPEPQIAPVTYNIHLNADGVATSSPTVRAKDKVEWTAVADSWVDPPPILSNCNTRILIPAGQTLPSPPCNVNGRKGVYQYSSGLQVHTGVGVGNDTITVED